MYSKFLPETPQQVAQNQTARPPQRASRLLLPGALLMAMRAQLLTPFMLINLRFPTFL
jgi:hypothetical protein